MIAYGQTGAGKTYTMQGCGEEDAEEEEEEEEGKKKKMDDTVGLIQRRSRRIFEFTNKTAGEEDVTHEVTCAYLEIYNEQLTDLLSDGDGNSDGIGMDGMMVDDAGNTGAIPALLGSVAAESWRYAKIQRRGPSWKI